jgi:3-oxoacyl-[acyl-carrier-protein] synthase III
VLAAARNTGRRGSRIAGLGAYRPPVVVGNEEIADRLGVTPEWIVARTGIRQRRIAEPGETVTDMAAVASGKALAAAEIAPEEVDAVVVATSTAPSTMPSVAAQISARLNLSEPAAFDLNNACAGFCYGLAVADAMVRAGTARSVLLVAADQPSARLDWDDPGTAIVFGDGAAAAVVTGAENPDIGPVAWGSFGDKADLVGIDPERQVLRMQGQSVFRWATGLAPLALDACSLAGVEPAALAGFVPHQANLRIVKALADGLGLGHAVVATDVTQSGNTVAASVPLALTQLVERGELRRGDPVLLFGFGAGLAYAGQVVRL